MAESFHHNYGGTFLLLEYKIQEETAVLPGLDGRKMSKSYYNIIPSIEEPKSYKNS
ncbi:MULTISPECIES: hypothetical protein [unclassified Peribacillus]|uniref:hypothetical protein n=1 Tax=unclassified Peribacillus TaxID=2675266 RepID=UPI0029544F3E|nr:hypothetical protein [Peribacillus sp. CSMR9]MDV7764568.1 hypothetical protein [Peribacillus sp. CSMR9]